MRRNQMRSLWVSMSRLFTQILSVSIECWAVALLVFIKWIPFVVANRKCGIITKYFTRNEWTACYCSILYEINGIFNAHRLVQVFLNKLLTLTWATLSSRCGIFNINFGIMKEAENCARILIPNQVDGIHKYSWGVFLFAGERYSIGVFLYAKHSSLVSFFFVARFALKHTFWWWDTIAFSVLSLDANGWVDG